MTDNSGLLEIATALFVIGTLIGLYSTKKTKLIAKRKKKPVIV